METIWKYPLPLEDYPRIQMPAGAELLHVDVQDAEPFLWARVDPDEPLCTRRLRGLLVFHVFDLGQTSAREG